MECTLSTIHRRHFYVSAMGSLGRLGKLGSLCSLGSLSKLPSLPIVGVARVYTYSPKHKSPNFLKFTAYLQYCPK